MRIPSRHHRGFTLIELLLAAAGGAIILAALVMVYGRAIRLRNTATEHIRASRLEARAINVLRNDLRGARLSGGLLAQTLDTYGSDTTTKSRFPGDLRFDTTSGSVNEDNFQPELQEVEYHIAEDPQSDGKSGILKRAVTRNLLAPVREMEAEESILSGVEAMEVAFYDGTDWQPTWEIDTTDVTVPSAVRVRITLADDAHPGSTRKTIEVLVPWTTQVAIPPATSTTDTDADDGTGAGTGTPAAAGTGTGTGTATGGTAR